MKRITPKPALKLQRYTSRRSCTRSSHSYRYLGTCLPHNFMFPGLRSSSLIGSIIKQLRFVRLYSSILAIHLGFSIGSGIFSMYTMFHKDSPEAMAKCINGSTEQSVKDACSKGLAVWKGIEVAIFVITWLIELCTLTSWILLIRYSSRPCFADGCIIVANYAEQLEEEEAAKMPNKASASTVTPFTTYSSFTPNNLQGQYAFSTTNQSFGQSGQNA